MYSEAIIQEKLASARQRGAKYLGTYEYKLRHPEKVADWKKRHYEKYRERILAKRRANIEKRRAYDKKRVRTHGYRHAGNLSIYGINKAQFNSIRIRQHNQCAICQEVFTKTPRVDHDHAIGQVRGLLCGPCNIGIGLLKDSAVRLRKAVKYIESRTVIL